MPERRSGRISQTLPKRSQRAGRFVQKNTQILQTGKKTFSKINIFGVQM
jgi:hypothetical protein